MRTRTLIIILTFNLTCAIGLLVRTYPAFAAQEHVDLAVPETKPTNPSYTVERLTLDWGAGTVLVQLKGQNGEALSKAYTAQTTPTGATLMIGLNKANLTTRSLNQRIFDRLIADGVIAGAVNGIVP